MSNYEITRKSKVAEYIENGVEFSIVDMERKKVYSSSDIRLNELHEKLNNDSCFIIKEVRQMRDINRLDDFYDELKIIHKECFPDWRFGQFMCNLERWLQANKGLTDIFYIEEYEITSDVANREYEEELERE